MSSHGGFENGLKKVKLQFSEHDGLEVEEIQDDLKSYILKARCDKVMPSQLMKIWKECGEDSLWGFARLCPYYPQINHEKKIVGKWVMYCVQCGVERSINPSFNLLNWKTQLSPKVSGLDSVHEKNLKLYQNKEIGEIKVVRKDHEKAEATMKRKEDWVFKYVVKGK
jgi:hypothetical protein